ncbi:MAG: TonB-dependent receptor [Leptolyngbyaceae cyanobacterium CRU_2_3]|nr:TonB-dependent receptor [Leptolyngbyaceae cyanobacterium CRU_2_3]
MASVGLLGFSPVDAAESQEIAETNARHNQLEISSGIAPFSFSKSDIDIDSDRSIIARQDLERNPVENAIPQTGEIAHTYTQIEGWMQAQTAISITAVRLNSTEAGVTVVLDTATGQLAPPVTSIAGKTLTADIPNAVLALPEGQDFQAENPIEGIASITVTEIDPTQVRVSVTGTEEAPTLQIVPGEQGLTLSLSPAAADTLRVVVTAQRRPEDPQDVPISLTVLSAEELEDAQVNSLQDVAANTPNFFVTTGDRSFNFYSIRGLGNSNVLVRDTASFYVDDVPYDNVHQFFSGDLFDLERVEVLRGPQSTLYGRNSLAGVINFISRPPSEALEFGLGASYGNFNQRRVQLSVSDSLIPDTLGFRLAGVYSARDGFTENTFLDESADEQENVAGRFNLVWTPTENWDVSLNATGSRENDGTSVYVPINQDDPFEIAQDQSGGLDLSTNTQSLRVAYNTPGLRFTSITAHNFTDYGYIDDGDGTIDNLGLSVNQLTQNIWSQEFRLQSPEEAERFRWLVGAYYQNRDFEIEEAIDFTPAGAEVFQLPSAGTDRSIAEYNQTTYAAFAQVDFQPIEPLTLTAGLRYENWRDQLSRSQVFEATDGTETPGSLNPLNDSTIDGDALLPRVAIGYRFNPNLFAYSSITRGYRPGTQNYRADNQASLIVEPEESWNYELGLKTSWLDDRLTFNIAAFYNDVTNYQVLLPGPDTLFRDIASAQARVLGVELELKATPFDGFDIIAGFGYSDARFTDYTNPFTNENFDGNRLLFSPEYTYNLALQYRSPGGLLGRLELQGLGPYYFDEANTLKEGPIALFNARVGYEFETYSVYVFVNNLLNTRYVTVAFPSGNDTLAGYGDRRTFGVQVQARF